MWLTGGGKGPVPMLHAGRDAHHVAGVDLLDRATPLLHSSGPGRDDQRLPERVRVQAVRAPGSKVTSPPDMREGGASLTSGRPGPSR